MPALDRSLRLFVITALVIQTVLVVFFALRKWNFPLAMTVGWGVYALAVPAVAVSVILIRAHKPWFLSIAGLLFALWASFGVLVDNVFRVQWRSPILWSVFLPYLLLYVGSMMFYWWPLVRIHRLSWFIYTLLYALSTLLNVTSHGW